MSETPTETPSPVTITVISPSGEEVHAGNDKKAVNTWMDQNKLGKGERYLVQTVSIRMYRPRSGRDPNAPKLTKEQRAEARAQKKAQREAERAAKKAQKQAEREAKKKAREAEKAARAAGKAKVVTQKNGTRHIMSATTSQLAALARARETNAARSNNSKSTSPTVQARRGHK